VSFWFAAFLYRLLDPRRCSSRFGAITDCEDRVDLVSAVERLLGEHEFERFERRSTASDGHVRLNLAWKSFRETVLVDVAPTRFTSARGEWICGNRSGKRP